MSRAYCVISAYNIGPFNVLRIFGKYTTTALSAVARLEPPVVYEKLRAAMPYEEGPAIPAKMLNYHFEWPEILDLYRQFLLPSRLDGLRMQWALNRARSAPGKGSR